MDRWRQLPAWLVFVVAAVAVLGYAWWKHHQAAQQQQQDQADEQDQTSSPDTIPASTANLPSTAGSVAPGIYAIQGSHETQYTSTQVPPIVTMPTSTSNATPGPYSGNTVMPADQYSTGHPTSVTYSQ